MSSVSSKSSSGQDEAVRKTREEYRKKEAELVKKQQKELREINERHSAEIARKDKGHDEQIKTMREKSIDTLTSKDVKYQKEIEDLRKMHTKQLERLMQENQTKLETQRQTAKSEIKQANLGKDDRAEALSQQYAAQTAEQNAKYRDQMEQVREEQKEALQRRDAQFRERYDNDLEIAHDERNETVSKLKNEYRQLSQSANQRLKTQEARHLENKMRMNANFMDTLASEREQHNDIQEITRDAYADNLDTMRDQWNERQVEERERRDEQHAGFKSDVDERMNNQVNRLKRDLANANNRIAGANQKARVEAKQEVDQMRDAYHEKFQMMEKEREAIKNQSNANTAKDIREIREKDSELMQRQERYYRDRMQTENFKNRQAIDTLDSEYALRSDYQKGMSQERVEKVIKDSQNREEGIAKNFDEGRKIMREGYENETKELRLALMKDRLENEKVMKNQIKEQEVEHSRRTNDIVSKYEKRIQELNDQFVREKRLRDNREKQLVADLKRQAESEKDVMRMQYEDKIKQSQVSHQEEKRELSRKHAENIDQVLTAAKKS